MLKKMILLILPISSALAAPSEEDRRHHRMTLEGLSLVEQAQVRPLIFGANPEVQAERSRCVQDLIARTEAGLKDRLRSESWWVFGAGSKEVQKDFWPFAWIHKNTPLQKPDTQGMPFQMVEHEEYRLVRFEAWSLGKRWPFVKRTAIDLPIRQHGRVIRDEGAGKDRVEIAWTLPLAPIEAVERDYRAKVSAEIRRSLDKGSKLLLSAPSGLSPELRSWRCQPDRAREYPVPASVVSQAHGKTPARKLRDPRRSARAGRQRIRLDG